MKSIASAPGKVILVGEHFVLYGIKAIVCAIDKRITATSQFLDQPRVRVKSLLGSVELSIDDLEDLNSVPLKFMKPFFHTIKFALEEFNKEKGIEVILKSQVPAGIGLGSSSAACVAVAASVTGLFRKKSNDEILKMAIESERMIFENVSGVDSASSIYGGIISYDKHGFEKIQSDIDFDLVIANSGEIHNTMKIVSEVRKLKSRDENFFEKICKEEEGIVNGALLALKENNMSKLGSLMSENQKLLREINVSTEKLDILVEEAQKTSHGAKITGAGGGGCMIALVDKHNSEVTLNNLKKLSDSFIAKIDHEGLRYTH